MAVQTASGVIPDAQLPYTDFVFLRKVEKQFMNPIRFHVNYHIIPAFIIFSAVCLLTGTLLIGSDEERYTPAFLVALGLVLAASVLLLITVPRTKKKELCIERARYCFDTSQVEKQPTYSIAYEGTELVFSADGILANGAFLWYSRLSPRLVTSNKFNRIWIAIRFGSEPLQALYVPLSPELLQAVQQFSIPLDNREALDYLLENTDQAFSRIYTTGKLPFSSAT